MMSRLRTLAAVFALFVAVSSLASCSFEPGEHTQLVGQQCLVDNDCVEGLRCIERRCLYTSNPGSISDAGADATSDTSPQSDAPSADAGLEDAGTVVCEPPGQRSCSGNLQVRICREDGSGYDYETCADGAYCQEGQCVPVDRDVCRFQNQPCNDEGMNNGYYCTDFEATGERRCLGVCNPSADDPDATCPESGSVCTFGDEQMGVCLSGCSLDEGCSTPGLGCLPMDGQQSEGICAPTNSTNRIGDACDEDNLFDCEEGAVCVNANRGGRCVEACRAFSSEDGSDCSNGHCMPLAAELGVCRPDAENRAEGEECRPQQLFHACGEDAVLCVGSGGWQQPSCQRYCRLELGNADCQGNGVCRQYDEEQEDLGLCMSP